jgi:hypothetical protein
VQITVDAFELEAGQEAPGELLDRRIAPAEH